MRLPVIAPRFCKGPIRHTGFKHSKILAVDHENGMQQSVAQLWNEMTKPERPDLMEAALTWQPEVEINANLPVPLVCPIWRS